MSHPDFTVDVYQNEYLAEGGQDVDAIVTVTSPDSMLTEAAEEPGGAEIIIIDCSGSMGAPPTKIAEAAAATSAALDVIRDGVSFAVIAGNHLARPVFPEDGRLAVATAQTRREAKQAVTGLLPEGGTAIGQWLRLAQRIFSSHSGSLRHAILLTDGKNQHEVSTELDAAISKCEGAFSCDCRGVGADWEVEELRRISSGLLGSVDIVPDPSGLTADFATMMEKAMSKQVGSVSLRIWTPQHASVQFLKQVAPTVEDLTDRRVRSGPQAADYPTGAWGPSESRDYHLGVRVTPASVGQEMLASRLSLITGPSSIPHVLGQALVRAIWTDDEALSTRINAHVAHYTGQEELAKVIQEGLEARKRGDDDTATEKLGRAVALAEQAGNTSTAALLAKVVEVVDAAKGTVRLRSKVDDVDEMMLDTRSTRTVRTRK